MADDVDGGGGGGGNFDDELIQRTTLAMAEHAALGGALLAASASASAALASTATAAGRTYFATPVDHVALSDAEMQARFVGSATARSLAPSSVPIGDAAARAAATTERRQPHGAGGAV